MWSKHVTKYSQALELEEGFFSWSDPTEIACSLKKSALESKDRKGTPYQSAMSMLNFYINRAGDKLTSDKRQTLEKAKEELQKVFDKTSP